MSEARPKRILVVDTPDRALSALREAFEAECAEGSVVARVTRCEDLLRELQAGALYDLVAIDYRLGDGERSGLDLLAAVRAIDPDVPVVVVASEGDVERARRAVDAGATDFLVRGERLAERVATLLSKVGRVLALLESNRALARQNRALQRDDAERDGLVFRSQAMAGIRSQITRVAAVPRPVLVLGERGTGKELVARAIHREAGPPGRPFVIVNCAAFPDALLERELFGHEAGAFTGAAGGAPGRFEQAHRGSLFLDELGNMGLAFQQKVLRVVEYGTFTRVGGQREVRVDVRIIGATNADLEARMREGTFLRDLYDRLAFEVIRLPALREHPDDIPVLAEHFIERFGLEVPAFRGKRLSAAALEVLRRYAFPGNVRELKTIIERAVYRDTTNELTPEDLGMLEPPEPGDEGSGDLRARVRRFERRLLVQALDAAHGNQAAAARRLGLSYHQLRYCLKKHGLAARDEAPGEAG